MVKGVNKNNKDYEFRGEPLENIFSNNSFKLFKDYCNKNNLKNDYDLKDFDFICLSKEKGFGPQKIKTITTVWKEYKNSLKGKNPLENKDYTIHVHEDYINMSIDSIKALFVDERIITHFKDNNISTVGDLRYLNLDNINSIPNIGKSKALKFNYYISLLKYPEEELITKVLDIIKEDENYRIYKLRAVKGITLQSIADKSNISRERVRQLEEKVHKKFKGYFKMFFPYMIKRFNKDKIFDYRDIRKIGRTKEESLILKYALINKASENVRYFEEIDKFIIGENIKYIRESLNSIAREVGDIFNYYDEIYNVEVLLREYSLSFLDYEDFINYLYKKGYKSHNNYVWKGSMKLSKCYGVIVKEYFKEGIRLSDKDNIEKVKNIFKDKFGRDDFCDNARAIAARIESENVLCNRGTYISPEYIKIPKDLLRNIKEYINNSTEETILISDLFYKFQEDLKMKSNIDNRYFLHGVLKYYYGDEFIFTKDNIGKNKDSIISSHKIFEKFLKDEGKAVSKKYIKGVYPGWTDSMFNNAVALNKNIIYWDNGYFINSSILKISKEDINKLKEILESQFKKNHGYTNANVVHSKVEHIMKDFIKRNNIKNSFNIYSILEYILGDEYYFRRPHILKEEPEKQFTTMDLFYGLFRNKEVISYREFYEHFNKLKFTERTIYNAFHRVCEELIEIDDDKYILKENLKLKSRDIEDITNELNKLIEKRKYYPLKTLRNYSFLPNIGFPWNYHFLSSIIENYIKDFDIVEKEVKDRRYRCAVLVRNNGEFFSIKDLIIYILKNEYRGSMNINSIQEYLRDKKVILKGIPRDVFQYEGFIVEEDGNVTIN
ncbi:sigma factor-like helix-turn-helix DNA-binding protein [Clostridium sp.]|uniref:sigma factor-like helix-turn-helix DNA-binding protein n=1 Tax=Clostridium sp. TaxID=1506 RepID=UPI003463B0A9